MSATSTPMEEPANNTTMPCPLPVQQGSPVDVFAYGLLYPVLALIVIFTNCNGIVILVKMRNFTQTNILLLSIFLLDLLTTVFPLPKFFYLFTVKWNAPLLPTYPWCFLSTLASPIMPTVTNNISIWLVALLSIQRCMCVRSRNLYERFFSKTTIIILVVVIAFLTLAFHSVLVISNFQYPESCFSEENQNVLKICGQESLIPNESADTVMSTYYISRVILFHLLPIVAIAASTAILIFVLYQAQNRLDRLHRQSETKTSDGSQQLSNAINVRDNLALIEEDEYRHASVNLPEKRKKSMKAALRSIGRASRDRKARKSLTNSAHKVDKRSRVATTTHMLVIISTVYLIEHIFQSTLFVTGMAFNFTNSHTETSVMAVSIAAVVGNLAYVAGFPAAFLLCFSVQEPFRETFYSIYEDNAIVARIQKRKQAALARNQNQMPPQRLSLLIEPPKIENPANSSPNTLVTKVAKPSPPEAGANLVDISSPPESSEK